MWGLVVALICLACSAAYIYLRKRYRYWKSLGIAGPEPAMITGNMKDIFSLKATEPAMMHQWYKEYRSEPYIGYYNLWKPTLFVLDPELIKAITEVDFNHFIDHPQVHTEAENDAILDSLFGMRGARWKAKRQLFSKLFSPKKLRELSNILEQHSDTLIKDLEELRKSTDETDLMRITEVHVLRIITVYLYGIDSNQNRATHNKLSQLSEIFSRPPGTSVFRFLLFTAFPNIYTKLGLSVFNSVFMDFFSHFTNGVLHSRDEMKVDRDDLVDIIAKFQKEGLQESEKITQHEAAGHFFTFFIASHHTTMTTLSHTIYQLSLHPQVQEKLRKEVDSVLNGKQSITYDSLKLMKYMDKVINETLRMFPLLGILKRTCTKPYKINDNFTIPMDMDISIPAYSIHMDPEYYPEPEKFLPERFSDATPPHFMAFGRGPRLCIGMRFAYVSMKNMLARIVSEYIILPGTKTRTPLQFDPKTFFITVHPIDGLHVKLEKRKKLVNIS